MAANARLKPYFCYTDGACKKTPHCPGGWGLFIKCPDGETVEKSGWAIKTSVATMELTAIAEALKFLPDGTVATIFSDSKSAIDHCTRLLEIWRKNGWKNCDSPDAELLKAVDSLLREKALTIDWQWVRGHNRNQGNERADQLAGDGARQAKAHLKDVEEEEREKKPQRITRR